MISNESSSTLYPYLSFLPSSPFFEFLFFPPVQLSYLSLSTCSLSGLSTRFKTKWWLSLYALFDTKMEKVIVTVWRKKNGDDIGVRMEESKHNKTKQTEETTRCTMFDCMIVFWFGLVLIDHVGTPFPPSIPLVPISNTLRVKRHLVFLLSFD